MTLTRKSRITRSAIDPSRVLASVRDRSAGGIVIFLGTVRNVSEGERVAGLRYEVYREMAEKRMLEIETEAKKRWPVMKMTVVHRVGDLQVGEVSVAVAVSSEHRAEAFEAGRYAIDAIKKTLPLWKKESVIGKKEGWVSGTPIER